MTLKRAAVLAYGAAETESGAAPRVVAKGAGPLAPSSLLRRIRKKLAVP